MVDHETLREDLRFVAEAAGTGPADLAEVVRRGFVRRRRRRAAGIATTVAVVVALAVSIPAIRSAHHQPATPPPLHTPPVGVTVPPAASVWPGALVRVPYPTGGTYGTQVLHPLDPTHLLVIRHFPAGSTTFYRYDVTDDSYRLIAEATGQSTAPVYSAVSPHWLVWEELSASGYTIYKVPLAGGTPTVVADLPRAALSDAPSDNPWYATDDNLYFSGVGPGVTVAPLAGGQPHPLAGFEQMHLVFVGSPWAVRADHEPAPGLAVTSSGRYYTTRELRNVVTGQWIPVTAPAPSDPAADAGLACVPAFCVEVARGRVTYLERLDGSGRVAVPMMVDCDEITAVGEGGRLLCRTPTDLLLYDPVSGRAGAVPGPGGTDEVRMWSDSGNLLPGDLVWGLVIAQTK